MVRKKIIQISGWSALVTFVVILIICFVYTKAEIESIPGWIKIIITIIFGTGFVVWIYAITDPKENPRRPGEL
jgi:drug/metabolite transporter (DMT)-like permease